MGTLRILVVGAAVLLLAGCGGDDDSAGDADFCERAVAFMEDSGAFDDPSTDTAQAALDEADDLDPPEEIADDWQILIDGARALGEIDPDTPTEEAEAELPPAVQNMGPASTNVFDYIAENCEIDVSG